MISLIDAQWVSSTEDGEGGYTKCYRILAVSDTEGEDYSYVTGEVVEGLNDSDEVAAGSIIYAPDGVFMAYSKGYFQPKA